ncbi:MAG: hypothetical protein E7009_04460 [Alphaproteobacteria bacterium]|nr:hypothetical protein [Alphaproteobacteria bacterium]
MPNPNVGLIAAMIFLFGIFDALAWKDDLEGRIGFAAPCTVNTANSATASSQCYTWCRNTYGTRYEGENVTVFDCSTLGITTASHYCCATNASQDIYKNCVCPDNAHTVGMQARQILNTGTSANPFYTFECYRQTNCVCNVGYYGNYKLFANATEGMCTECPCSSDVTKNSTGEIVCGTTPHLTSATNTPITSCYIGTSYCPNGVDCSFNDASGNFTMGICNYSN